MMQNSSFRSNRERSDYLVALEEFEDGEDDIVYIAKPRRLALLRMMQPPGPIDGDIMAMVELHGAADGSSRIGLAKTVQSVEDGAILADVEAL